MTFISMTKQNLLSAEVHSDEFLGLTLFNLRLRNGEPSVVTNALSQAMELSFALP